jgi:predicted nucleic acid-binding protein
VNAPHLTRYSGPTIRWRTLGCAGALIRLGDEPPVRILLDTSVIIDLADVELGVHESAEPAVSAVSVAELAFGLDIDDPIERRARAERYRVVREQLAVLTFDVHAAEIYGTMAAVIRRAGRNPRPRRIDLQIAATAAAHSIPLITRDLDGFAGLERLLQVVVV